jgi:hypothetical protein
MHFSSLARTTATAALLCAISADGSTAWAQSATVPAPAQLVVTPVVTYQSFDEIWAGGARMPLPDALTQQSYAVALELGVSDAIALDATFGWSVTNSAAFGGPASDRGLTDSTIGLRWQLLNGNEIGRPGGVPTITARVGAIMAGSYRASLPFSVGDGGSGVEASLLVDERMGRGLLGLRGEYGYRWRNHGVPQDLFGSAGLYRTFGPTTVSGSYRATLGRSGPDIGDPGFEFPRLRETNHLVDVGVGLSKGSRAYQFFMAKSLGGRNTGDKLVVGAAVTFSRMLR